MGPSIPLCQSSRCCMFFCFVVGQVIVWVVLLGLFWGILLSIHLALQVCFLCKASFFYFLSFLLVLWLGCTTMSMFLIYIYIYNFFLPLSLSFFFSLCIPLPLRRWGNANRMLVSGLSCVFHPERDIARQPEPSPLHLRHHPLFWCFCHFLFVGWFFSLRPFFFFVFFSLCFFLCDCIECRRRNM